jgi:hypothetical protein
VSYQQIKNVTFLNAIISVREQNMDTLKDLSLESRYISFSGREGAINLEQLLPLAESIFENWNPESFDKSLLIPVGAGVEEEIFYKY